MTDIPDSARAIIQALMEEVGLGSLGDWAWAQYQSGVEPKDIVVLARQTPEYAARYPAMAELNRAGRGITEGQYQAYESTVRSLVQNFGLPKGMYDTPQDIANLLVKDVSTSEITSRIQLAAAAAYTAPAEVRQALTEKYGLTPGDMIGYWLDPDKAMPLIERQYNAAQIMGAGSRYGVDMGAQTAEEYAARGVGYDAAAQGFGQVAKQGSLTAGPGETITQAELVDAQFGGTKAQQKAERVAGGRVAAFSSGGGAVAGQAGVTGLGTASTN